MQRIQAQTDNSLDRLAQDPIWGHDPSSGPGASHLLNRYASDLPLSTWSKFSPDDVNQELCVRISTAHPDWPARQVSEAAKNLRAALAEALCERADRTLRRAAAATMRATARDLTKLANNPRAARGKLAMLYTRAPGRDRIALFEALSLDSAAARGLDVQMANKPLREVIEHLDSPRGLAMVNREPLTLGEFRRCLAQTGAALSALAQRIENDRETHVFDLCPALGRGLINSLGEGSMVREAIRERLEHHATCQAMDSHLAFAASLVFHIGALMAGPLGHAVHLAWGAYEGIHNLEKGTEKLRLSNLSHLAKTMGEREFKAAREGAYRAQVLGTAALPAHATMNGGMLLALVQEMTAAN